MYLNKKLDKEKTYLNINDLINYLMIKLNKLKILMI